MVLIQKTLETKNSLTMERLLEILTNRRSQEFYKLVDVHSVTNVTGESISSNRGVGEGQGVKTNLLQFVNFQTKVCCFKLYLPYHGNQLQNNDINPHKLPFSMLNFPLVQTFALGSMRSGLKCSDQKHWLASWKPTLSIREHNSSHLQDLSNAFLTKNSVK